jgi:hypothetical protein
MFFKPKRPSIETELQEAKALYEQVVNSPDDSRAVRQMRTRLALLLRAHIDKTFVAGAEKTAAWQDAVAMALTSGLMPPPEPEFNHFQKVQSGEREIWVYLPPDIAKRVFTLGAQYQKTHVSAQTAIQTVQAIVDHLCRYELGLDSPFVALKFLRDELEEQEPPDSTAPPTLPSDAPGTTSA